MKFQSLLLAACIVFACNSTAQSIQPVSGNKNIKVSFEGIITVKDAVKGYFRPDGTIDNASNVAIGYLKSDGSIENSSHETVGYIKSDGSVENASHVILGYVKGNVVENAKHSKIGESEAGLFWTAVAYFFFSL